MHETWHTTLFGVDYCVEMVRIEIIFLKLRAKLRFLGFLSFYGTFAYKVAQTWFFFCTKLGTQHYLVYYCVEIRIESHSHMLEIRC